MNKRIKEEWIKRLRSGEYEQTTGALHIKDDGYCCLGVLCEIHMDESKNRGKWTFSKYGTGRHLKSSGVPSIKVQEWAELSYPVCSQLARINDSGSTFKSIAKTIEEQY